MRKALSKAVGVGIALLATLAGALGPARASDPASAIVVFDGSGSMWGKLEGERQTKFVLAREALRSALGKSKPAFQYGLLSFGHRRQGDCSDVQLIHEPQAGALDKIMAPLERLNPKGRGPLTAALKDAAKALGQSGGGPKSLIVIHDDQDNCQQDTCSALTELQSSAPGLAIHVIGLGLKGDDATKLTCLTTPTSGTFTDAQDSNAITQAIEEAVRQASLETPRPAPQQRPQQPATARQPSQVPSATRPTSAAEQVEAAKKEGPLARPALLTTGPSAVRLAAVLAPNANPLPRPVQWSVRQEQASGAQVFAGTGQDLVVPLPAGKYFVEARDGMVIARQSVAVAERGMTAAELVLNAGILRLTGVDESDAGRAARASATITLFEASTSGRAGALGRPLGVLSARDAQTLIPAGNYVARIEQGPLRSDRPLVVTAGGTQSLAMQDGVGRLLVAISGADTASGAAPIIVSVAEDDPDSPRGRREFSRSAAPEPDFLVAPGTYYVSARQGRVEARERLAVAAGETVQRTLNLASARLMLSSRIKGYTAAGSEPVSYRIERIDVVPPDVFFADQSTPALSVPAGRYRIEARHGLVNVRARQEIELRAREQRDVTIEHEAGQVHLKLASASGAAAQDVFWDIRDQSGRPVWTAAQAEPRVTLQAGRYLLRAEAKDRRIERILEVKTGDNVVVEVRE
jgi:Ca-activated chloride channel family protein